MGLGLYANGVTFDGSDKKVVKAAFNAMEALLELHQAVGLGDAPIVMEVERSIFYHWVLNTEHKRLGHRLWASVLRTHLG